MNDQFMNIYQDIRVIDFDALLQSCEIFVLYYLTNRLVINYKINRDFDIKKYTKVTMPPVLKQKYTSVEIKEIKSKKIEDAVIEFKDFMLEKFPNHSLTNFYNNINEAKIKFSRLSYFTDGSGYYASKYNTLGVSKYSSIYHELFHLASAIFDQSRQLACVGFRQHYYIKNSPDIGRGINEGYTEILAHRYFGDKHKMSKAYLMEVNIVKNLEKIVGQDAMETMYLNADLPGLITELTKYTSEKEILKFISNVDFLAKHAYDLLFIKHSKLEQSVIEVGEFLFKTYVAKLKRLWLLGLIDKDEFCNKFDEYTKELGTRIRVGCHNYKFLTPDRASEIVEEVLGVNEVTNVEKILKR